MPAGNLAIMLGVPVDATRLRNVLEAAGPSLRAVAARVDVDEKRLSDWMADRSAPQPATLHHVLSTIGADLADVLPAGAPVTLEMLRWRTGMTAQQAATAAGMPRARYADLEAGRRAPTGHDLERLATAFDVDLAKLRTIAGRHTDLAWTISLDTTTAGRIERARRDDEDLSDTIRRVIATGLNQLTPAH